MDIIQFIALNHLLNRLSITNYEPVLAIIKDGKNVFNLSESELSFYHVQSGLSTSLRGIRSFKEYEDEIKNCDRQNAHIITINDNRYPRELKEIPSPPIVLYYKGELQDNLKAIAVVGARDYTQYGEDVTRYFAGKLASFGITIVSGLARGIDHIAHAGALEASGYTIGVSGCGIDDVYPKENRELYERILDKKGVILTEFPLKTEVRGYNFPRRNRIISGLSLGVLVTEARIKSGSLITARFAVEQNREVFAVPGDVFNEMSEGPNELIKRGAKIVRNYTDILEELFPQLIHDENKTAENSKLDKKCEVELGKEEEHVLSYLDYTTPKHLDDLIFEVDINVGELTQILIGLEMKNVIRELPGNHYIRIHHE